MIKYGKFILMLFTFVCFIAMGVCLIADMAINSQITWSAYPLISIPFGWLVFSPLLVKKYGFILSPCVLTVAVIPYLFLLEKITTVTDWFLPIGVPSAIIGIVFTWIIYTLFRFVKINLWYKLAITVFLAGVIASPVTNYFVDIYTQSEPSYLNMFINIFSCILVSVILAMYGYRRSKGKPKN